MSASAWISRRSIATPTGCRRHSLANCGHELAALNPAQLVVPIENRDRGNFLTFRSAEAGALHQRLLAADIVTDYRGDRLRFGFGIYHDAEDIDRLMDALRRVLR